MKQVKKRHGGGNSFLHQSTSSTKILFECILLPTPAIRSRLEEKEKKRKLKEKKKLDDQPPQKRPEVIISEEPKHETKQNIYSICYFFRHTTRIA